MAHQLYRPNRYEDEDANANPRPRVAEHGDFGPPTEFTPPDFFLEDVDLDALEAAAPEFAPDDATPSLPVILVSAACGLGGGVIGLYLAYVVFAWPLPWVAAASTLALLFSLGISGALMSAATGTRAAPANILFSCGLLLAATLFLGLCSVVGALTATLIFRI
ncbi:MAG: hypothetical protein WDZ49_07930 [Litorilinea sp.]